MRKEALICAFPLLLGCMSVNAYSVPRTLPPGEARYTTAITVSAPVSPSGAGNRAVWPGPNGLSSLHVIRFGLAERLEGGVRLGAPWPALGAELKWNFLRTRRLDISAAPFFDVTPIDNGTDGFGAIVHFPVLVGLNVVRELTIVGSYGFAHGLGRVGFRASESHELGPWGSVERANLPFLRASLGLAIRAQKLTVFPEATLLRGVRGHVDGPNPSWYLAPYSFVVFGIGFTFGRDSAY